MHCSPLLAAAQFGDVDECDKLVKAGADVNTAWFRETALYKAVVGGHEACASLLLKAGADVNAVQINGRTPLHRAVAKDSEACVSLLLQAGADVHATNKDGQTVWHMAIAECDTPIVAVLASSVPRLHVPPQLLRPSAEDAAAMADESHWRHAYVVAQEKRRAATIAVLQSESRWRRRRPLALIREQRRAVRDAGLVHKKWEMEQEEAAAAAKRAMR